MPKNISCDCYFWAVHAQAQLDLLIIQGTQRMGFEFKFSKTPQLTKSMQTGFNILKLDKLKIIYLGEKLIRLTKEIVCVGLEKFLQKT